MSQDFSSPVFSSFHQTSSPSSIGKADSQKRFRIFSNYSGIIRIRNRLPCDEFHSQKRFRIFSNYSGIIRIRNRLTCDEYTRESIRIP